MKKWTRVLLLLGLLPLAWSCYYYPYEYGRLWHLIFSSPDLYSPRILESDVSVAEHREYIYDMDFDHFDYHDVGLIFEKGSVPSSFSKTSSPYAFRGKIVVELLSNGNIVRKTVVTEPLSYKFYDDDIEFYKSMVLDRFPLPFKGRYSGFKIRLKIIESDPVLEISKVGVYFSVSTTL